MRFLGNVAYRKGLSMLQVAKLAGADIKAFGRYFESKNPRPSRIRAVATALGFPEIVSRVLSGLMEPADFSGEWAEIKEVCTSATGFAIFGRNILRAADMMLKALQAGAAFRAEFFATSVLARHGLLGGDVDAALGPYFSSLNTVLVTVGADLRPLVEDRLTLIERKRDGVRRLPEIIELLNLSERASNEMTSIALRYAGDALEYVEELDSPEAKEREERRQAELAADPRCGVIFDLLFPGVRAATDAGSLAKALSAAPIS